MWGETLRWNIIISGDGQPRDSSCFLLYRNKTPGLSSCSQAAQMLRLFFLLMYICVWKLHFLCSSEWGSLVLSVESIYFYFLYWNGYFSHRELSVFVYGSSFLYSQISWLNLFSFPYQKSTWHASNCVYPLQLIDSHISASNVRYYCERFLFASLIKQLFTGAYSYNKINW